MPAVDKLYAYVGKLMNGRFSPPHESPDWHNLQLFDTIDADINSENGEVRKIKLRWYWNDSGIKASWRNFWIARDPVPAVDVWYEERQNCKFYVQDTGEKVCSYMDRLLSIERLFAACAVRYEDGSVGIPLMPVDKVSEAG